METVYLETSIISYLVSRPSRDLIVAGHQQMTRDWWTLHRPIFDCYISQVVLDEAAAGDPAHANARIDVVADLPLIEITEESESLAAAIMASGVMPYKAVRDAADIAVATVGQMNYLLTWNCKHLANARLQKQIAGVCRASGFDLPVICTPEELIGDYNNV